MMSMGSDTMACAGGQRVLCDNGSLLPPLLGFQGLNPGHQAYILVESLC